MEQLENLEDSYSLQDGINAEQFKSMAGDHEAEVTVHRAQPSMQKTGIATEARYMQRDLKEQGHDMSKIDQEEIIRSYGTDKERLDLGIKARRRVAEIEATQGEAEKRFSGSWFRKYQTQADELHDNDDFSQTRKSGKMLDEFISQKEGV